MSHKVHLTLQCSKASYTAKGSKKLLCAGENHSGVVFCYISVILAALDREMIVYTVCIILHSTVTVDFRPQDMFSVCCVWLSV